MRWAWSVALLVTASGVRPAAAQPLSPADLPPPANTSAPVEEPRPEVRRPANAMPSFIESPTGVTASERRPARTVDPDERATVPVRFEERERDAEPRRTRAATLAPPTSATPIAASRVETAGKVEADDRDPVNDLLNRRADRKGKDATGRSSGKIGEQLEGMLGNTTDWFKSDHTFDGMVSPVTNPFLFEDPRSLTEVRPIFLYQRIPTKQPDFLGGNISFFGTQLRLAITDRWSVVFNKLGGLWLNPDSSSPIDGSGGFAELWLGPKYTFVRNEEAGRVMAGGLMFQIPAGSKSVYQSTGTLSLVPYVSYAESFGRDWQWGGVNVMSNVGYSLSTNNLRSDYFYASAHIDWDVGNYHRIYPLAELNYYLYTTNGSSTPVGSEGRDLINFGGSAKGNGMLSLAFGARGKISESAQVGFAYEFPLAGNRDLFQYRFTIDFILRY